MQKNFIQVFSLSLSSTKPAGRGTSDNGRRLSFHSNQTFLSPKNRERSAAGKYTRGDSLSPFLSVSGLEHSVEDVALGAVALGAGSAALADHNQTSKCFFQMLQTSLSGLERARPAGGRPALTHVRNYLKADVPFPKRRPEDFQAEEPGGVGLWRTWQICLLPPGLDERGLRVLAGGRVSFGTLCY